MTLAQRAPTTMPGRTGTVPVVVSMVILGLAAALFVLSPSLDPSDLLAGRLFEVRVPDVGNMTQDRALLELDRERLRGDVEFVYSSDVERGKVVEQEPIAETSVKRDSVVALSVSRGPAFVQVPLLVGATREAALEALTSSGLEPAEQRVNSEEVAKGIVMSQDPRAGLVVEGGDEVEFVVSLGPVTRSIPDVANMPVEGAAFTIGKAGFVLGELTMADNAMVPAGSVVGTDPPVGSVLPRDTPVNLVVSVGPPPSALPQVTGIKQVEAAKQLAGMGLVVGEVTQIGAVRDPMDGVVLGQTPGPGTMMRAGDVVTLTVRRAATPPPTAPPTTAPRPVTTAPPATGVPETSAPTTSRPASTTTTEP